MSLTISPEHFDAVILDMDGVVTDTLPLRSQAWRRLFDQALAERGPRPGEDHRSFTDVDYRLLVDGRTRYDGAAAVLESRGVVLPWGEPGDCASTKTICGLVDSTDKFFARLALDRGVQVFAGTVVFVRPCRLAGLHTAVVSGGVDSTVVLAAAGVESLFEICLEDVVPKGLRLPGKTDPAILLEAAHQFAAKPERVIVAAHSAVGVAAARRGGFGLVVGVDHTGHAAGLVRHGADRVVMDLSELTVVGSVELDSVLS